MPTDMQTETLPTSATPVLFENTTLYLVEVDGEPYVPMKPVVEGMGLDWSSQHRKLVDPANRWDTCMVIMTMQLPGDNQRREVACLPLRKLPGWLMTIQPSRVSPEIRETVIAYQNECDDVLWNHWSSRSRKPAPPQLPQNYLEALKALVVSEEQKLQIEAKNRALEQQIETDKPYANLGKVVSKEEARTRREWIALMKSEEGLKVGEKKVNQWLRDQKIVYDDALTKEVRAYAQYSDWFTLSYEVLNGFRRPVLKITGRGMLELTPRVLAEFG